MHTLRGLLFWLGFGVWTLVSAVVVLSAWPLPFRLRFRVSRFWPHGILGWLRVCHGIRHEVSGMEHIPQSSCVVLSKHQSTWETLALQLILPPQVWVAKRELLWVPVFGWGLYVMRPIAINRKSPRAALRQLLAQGGQRLRAGINVLIFPEGTRAAPGAKSRYHQGGAHLAVSHDVPVLPVAHNAGLFWPRRSLRKRPGVIRVVIGPPIASSGLKPQELTQRVEAWIETETDRLVALEQAEAEPASLA